MIKEKEIENDIIVIKCRECGEYLHVEKKTENWKDANGKKRTKTFNQLFCPACGKIYN